MLLYPAFLSASRQFQLSIIASLAICDLLERLKIHAKIKWPNDILAPGGKIAGILIENGVNKGNLSYTIIGIGLNVNQNSFPEFPLKASSVRLETGSETDIHSTAEMLSDRIYVRYNQLKNGEDIRLKDEYLAHLFLAGQTGRFNHKGVLVSGTIKGISEFGELLLDTGDGVEAFSQHELKSL
jgi:BirA family biotin operon repressor/biotin-[acetyl-CoA-carboxylase] ligase